MEKMKIVGMVDVAVDGATYSRGAQMTAEHHARSMGLQFVHSVLGRKPELEEAENFPKMHMCMTNGLPSWSYTIWLVA